MLEGEATGGGGCSEDRRLTITEDVSGERLHAEIIAIICEEWPTPDGYLQSATIYERLINEGVEVPDRAISAVLLQQADDGRITLAVDTSHADDEVRRHGAMTIHHVS
jgi:hypothetical protein